MATARALYSDLILNFTLGTNTSPTIAQVALLITQMYKDAFSAVYGVNSYKVYDAAAEDSIIDNEEGKSIIIGDATDLVNKWADSFKINSQTKAPLLRLSDKANDQFANLSSPNMWFTSREDDDLEEVGDNIL